MPRGTLSPVGRRVGIGRFAGAVAPQDPTQAVAHQLWTSLAGDPGVRLAEGMAARASRRYTGTAMVVQNFVRQPAGSNSDEALQAIRHAPIKRNRSRALGQFRGLPSMGLDQSWPNNPGA